MIRGFNVVARVSSGINSIFSTLSGCRRGHLSSSKSIILSSGRGVGLGHSLRLYERSSAIR